MMRMVNPPLSLHEPPGPAFAWIRLTIDGQVATVTMARPAQRNAFTPEMMAEITRAFQLLAADGRVRRSSEPFQRWLAARRACGDGNP